ncbi:ion transporter [Pedobacter sp. SD-b]|uniref:Ion transporter n=1 Tax=Pedobacter segetis TaxID=2793069 RepID=A0ABS1BN66_9SPHI|nr:ion channel [Pedobacter segetis]MBK0384248.1 ion transporter [Pedobacter segetis]
MIKIKHKSRIDEDMGFGKNPTQNNQRLLNKDGSSNIKRKGLPFFKPHEAYNSLIFMSWSRFWITISLAYVSINLFFAMVYFGIGMQHLTGSVSHNSLDKFLDAFFFSAQTIATVGYGHLSPSGFLTNIVAAFESFLGLLTFALATGLLYGRFSRPTAKIIYSKNMVVAPYQNGKGYMFRLANLRSNQLIELSIEVLLSINVMESGKTTRRFVPLKLERSSINLLTLSWTVVHPLEEDSPLINLTPEDLMGADAEFIVMLKAFDDAFSQTVHSRTSYKASEVMFDSKFAQIIKADENGIYEIDISKVSEYEKSFESEKPAFKQS